jgi:hypothetical protein
MLSEISVSHHPKIGGDQVAASVLTATTGLIPMDAVGTYLHWGVIQISAANLAVIVLMLVVFALALILPFPRSRR